MCSILCECKPASSSSGVAVVRDGSVAGSVHPGFPAALPLPQPAHHRALSSPGEGVSAGIQPVGQRLALASSCNTHPLSLTQSVRRTDRRSLRCLNLNLTIFFMPQPMMSAPLYVSLTTKFDGCNINQATAVQRCQRYNRSSSGLN